MKRNVILIAPPTKTHRTPEENLGLEYLAAEVINDGHQVGLIDAWLEELNVEQTVQKILSYYFKPDIVGISPSMDSLDQSLEIVKKLRKNRYKGITVMGGVFASFEAERILEKSKGSLNGIIKGEADETFLQLLKDGNFKDVPHAVYWEKSRVVNNKRGHLVENLDSLPLPDRSLLSRIKKHKTPVHISASRGCYGNCSFCSIAYYLRLSEGKKWRGRSPESIVDEFKKLEKLGVEMVKFTDDNFFGPGPDRSREFEFINLMKKNRIRMGFRLSTRVNNINFELFKQLKEVGLFAVSVGVESGVQRKLNDYRKGVTVEQNLKAIKILKDLEIYAQMGFILFDPFVTIGELEKELDFLYKTQWAITKGICTILFAAEGTAITNKIKKTVGFIEKKETNYKYQIIDVKVQAIYEALRVWNKKNSRLYEMAIDPISTPKVVNSEMLRRFHSVYARLKKLDLEVFEDLIRKTKKGYTHRQLKRFVRSKIAQNSRSVKLLWERSKKLYREAGLKYKVSRNRYI